MAIVKTASQVPSPQVIAFADLLDLDDYDVPSSVPALPEARSILAGQTVWVNDFNRNAAYLDLLAQAGGGMIAIVGGFAISDGGGLTADIAAGVALAGALKRFAADTVVLSNNSDNFIWAKQDGTYEVETTTTPPTGICCYIGCVTTAAGAVTVIDYSGVVYLYSGVSVRETADIGQPTDTPPATWNGYTKCQFRDYTWNGLAYKEISDGGYLSVAMSDANHTVTDTQGRKSVLKFTGTLTAARDIVLPNIPGMKISIVNKTTGGYSLQVKVSGQTGVTLNNGDIGTVYCDGTDYAAETAFTTAP